MNATVMQLHTEEAPLKTSENRTVGTTQDRIRSFIDRIERLEGEIEGLKEDHKEIYKPLHLEPGVHTPIPIPHAPEQEEL